MDCVHPRTVRNPKTRLFMTVPCQHCIGCRLAKTREWKLRLMMEKHSWKESCFITLTYDDDHLHVTSCGHATLWPSDIQNFFKRVRQFLHRWKIKNDPEYAADYRLYKESLWMAPEYRIPSPPLLKNYYCGEYGDKFGRPHYHAIVFGTEFAHKGNWWIHHYEGDKPVWTSDELIDLWPFGLPTVDIVTEADAGYVAGYVKKKIFYDPMQYFKEYGCCVFPYSHQSQGIGYDYYVRNRDNNLFDENLRFRMKGVSYTMPRFFLKKDENMAAAMEVLRMRQEKRILESRIRYDNDVASGYVGQKEKELKAMSSMKR